MVTDDPSGWLLNHGMTRLSKIKGVTMIRDDPSGLHRSGLYIQLLAREIYRAYNSSSLKKMDFDILILFNSDFSISSLKVR